MIQYIIDNLISFFYFNSDGILLIFFLLTPLWLLILKDLMYYFYKKNKYINLVNDINKNIWLDSLLDKNWFNNISYPVIFISRDEHWIDYIEWVVLNSIDDYKKDLFLTNEAYFPLNIIYCIDSNFKKYNVSFSDLSNYWYLEKKYWNMLIPILTKTDEIVSYEEIEKYLDEFFFDNQEKENYKSKNLPKTIETIIKVIDNKI